MQDINKKGNTGVAYIATEEYLQNGLNNGRKTPLCYL